MTRLRIRVGLALGACVTLSIAGFFLLAGPMRALEISGVVALLRSDRVSSAAGYTVQALPVRGFPFRAVVTPFCSSLIAILALFGISMFILHGPLARRVAAFVAAASVIVACNVIRVAASVWLGVRMGDSAMILFHDWVGTIFALIYTMAGFLLMLWLMLPRDGRMLATVHHDERVGLSSGSGSA